MGNSIRENLERDLASLLQRLPSEVKQGFENKESTVFKILDLRLQDFHEPDETVVNDIKEEILSMYCGGLKDKYNKMMVLSDIAWSLAKNKDEALQVYEDLIAKIPFGEMSLDDVKLVSAVVHKKIFEDDDIPTEVIINYCKANAVPGIHIRAQEQQLASLKNEPKKTESDAVKLSSMGFMSPNRTAGTQANGSSQESLNNVDSSPDEDKSLNRK